MKHPENTLDVNKRTGEREPQEPRGSDEELENFILDQNFGIRVCIFWIDNLIQVPPVEYSIPK